MLQNQNEPLDNLIEEIEAWIDTKPDHEYAGRQLLKLVTYIANTVSKVERDNLHLLLEEAYERQIILSDKVYTSFSPLVSELQMLVSSIVFATEQMEPEPKSVTASTVKNLSLN